MITPTNIEAMFNRISEAFTSIAEGIENINTVIEILGVKFTESMMGVSEEIESLSNTLQFILKIDDLKNLKTSIHQIVDTFRQELDPQKLQKLTKNLTQTVKDIKEIRKAEIIKEESKTEVGDKEESS